MKPIAITIGDPAGIGPEIIAKAYAQEPELTRGTFVVGDVECLRRGTRSVAGDAPPLPVAVIDDVVDVVDVPPRCIPLLQVGTPFTDLPTIGKVDAAAGRLAAEAVTWAARAALRGDIAALVTAPLHKEALAAAGVPFPGHTELLQAEAALHAGVAVEQMPVRMMLANEELRTVLVSIHVALRAALDAVTCERVLETLRITDRTLTRALGRRPKVAVAGLNPHAGEGGLFGREELDVIVPAMQAAESEGLDLHGPFAPDTVFMRARRGEFDVVVAMYHDQGLIPVKYLGVEKGVNVTLGLPLVRTSPDHGTAFDIAGTGKADASSLVEAIRMARGLAGVR
ncbi:4-hydroxythreonine-4-phosphate dehydrogenase PdxA [Ramlibacter sp. USB13]|uniref:4-hydroxythreonine-4-phosphate dehydrogenase n=1 Tax=Ramlibacter cellulosilyticus TaxID=2764187 RepID=A0A923SC20_9BURK|nr:4-hydroxythreonine-4-phosphate dehydrogenase PdxA [Ramlibacter cellulosilyticus]MBC5784511.1 4-hydroxythreonine-4-phosphate dehydrogenase PdxA [Ramlibacter cellulosilyticus]